MKLFTGLDTKILTLEIRKPQKNLLLTSVEAERIFSAAEHSLKNRNIQFVITTLMQRACHEGIIKIHKEVKFQSLILKY